MNKDAKQVTVSGKQLICSVCGEDQFWERETLMNTAGASFFGFDWANQAAQNYICEHCGYVYWFLKK